MQKELSLHHKNMDLHLHKKEENLQLPSKQKKLLLQFLLLKELNLLKQEAKKLTREMSEEKEKSEAEKE